MLGKKCLVILLVALLFSASPVSATTATGVYHPAEDINPGTFASGGTFIFPNQLNVNQNLVVDTNTLYVDSVNNRIGIATSSPQYALDVNGNQILQGDSYLYFGDTTKFIRRVTGTGLEIGATNTLPVVITGTAGLKVDNGPLNLDSNLLQNAVLGTNLNANGYNITGLNTMKFSNGLEINGPIENTNSSQNSGNVYVADNFEVNGNILFTSGASRSITGPTGASQEFNINAGGSNVLDLNNGAGGTVRLFVDHSGSGLELQIYDQAAGQNDRLDLSHTGTYGLIETSSTADHLVLQGAGGNVGIGTTSPAGVFHVNGASGSQRVYISSSDGTGNHGIMFRDGAVNEWLIERIDSNNQFRITEEGVANHLVISAGGNVGIGTTSPGAKLDVKLGSDADYLMIQRNSATGRSQIVLANESAGEQWRVGMTGAGSQDFSFFDGTQNALVLKRNGDAYFTPNGNVGIGTTTPRTKLDVAGTGNVALFGTNSLVDEYIAVRDTASGVYFGLDADLNGGNGATLIQGGTNKAIAFKTNLAAFGSGTPDVYIDTSGNVGIGTIDPASWRLRVAGDARINGEIQVGNDDTGLRVPSNDNLAVFTGNTERVRINGTGSVGIGTTSPSAKLHVMNGSIRVDNGELQSWGSIDLHPDVDSSGDDTIRFLNNAGSEIMRVHTDGNVGIGTTTPSGKLSIGEYIRFDPNNALGNSNNGPDIAFESANGAGVIAARSHLYLNIDGDNSGDGELYVGKGTENNTATNLVTVKNSGSVGIGTTTPGGKLTVKGSGTANQTYLAVDSSTNQGQFYVFSDISGNAYADVKTSGGTTQARIHSSGNTYFTGGNVGIGTSVPTTLLEVGGSPATPLILTRGNSQNVNMKFNSTDASVFVGLSENNNFAVGSQANLDASPFFVINTTTGNVGIGTTNPGNYKLYVEGDTYIGGVTVTNGTLSYGGDLDMQNNLVTNIGHANTDFTSGGGLNIAGDIDMLTGNTAELKRVGSISFDWTGGTYNTAQNHGIRSYDESANLADSLSVNSYNDIINRLDSNNNNANSYFKVEHHATTNGEDLFWINSPNGDAYLKGNLGIGTTTTPFNTGSGLMISRSTPATIRLESTSGGSTGVEIYANATGLTFQQMNGNRNFAFLDGNVGVGTTTPGQKLDVNGNARVQGSLVLRGGGVESTFTQSYNAGNDHSYGNFDVSSTGTNTGVREFRFFRTTNSTGQTQISVYKGDGTATAGAQISGNTGNTYFNVLGGNLGIGTTAPGKKLDIDVGTQNTDGIRINGTGANVGITLKNSGTGGSPWSISSSGAGHADGNGKLLFSTDFNSPAKVAFTNSGNVGIGTVNPSNTLTVEGTVQIGTGGVIQPILYRDSATGGLIADTQGGSGDFIIRANGGENARVTSGGTLKVGGIANTARYATIDYQGTLLSRVDDNSNAEPITVQNRYATGTYGVGYRFDLGTGSANNAITAGRVMTVPEQTWTTTTTTQDSYMAFSTAQDGTTAEKVRITSAGNVGIGTTSPNTKLEVAGVGRFTGANGLSIGSDVGQNRIQLSTSGFTRIGFLDSGNSYIPLSAEALSIGTNYGDTAAPTNGAIIEGNVGIGTTSPEGHLHVAKGAESQFFLGSPASGQGGVIQTSDNRHRVFIGANIEDDPSSSWKAFTAGKGQAGISILADQNDWGTGITFITSTTQSNYSNNDVRMHISGAGNVGIGTNTPSSLLNLKSSARTDLRFDSDISTNGVEVAALNFHGKDSTGTAHNYGQINSYIISNTDGAETGGIRFQPGGYGGDFVVIRGDNGGRVGIGNTAPSYKLDVNGNMRIADSDDTLTLDGGGSTSEIVYTSTTAGNDWQVGTGWTGSAFGTDAFYFYNGGEKASINDDGGAYFAGNVGIGRTPSSGRVEVNTDGNIELLFSGTAQSANLYSQSGGDFYLGTYDNQNLRFRINNADRAILDTNGYFHVGSGSATGRLSLKAADNGWDEGLMLIDDASSNQYQIIHDTLLRFGYNSGTIATLDASGNFVAVGSSRAPIFYDQDNTAYYINPAGTSVTNDMRASIFYDQDNTGYYVNPYGTSRLDGINTDRIDFPGSQVSLGTNRGDDGSYEYVEFRSGAPRPGIILWDGSWSGCDANKFCIFGDTHQLMLASNTGNVYVNDELDVAGDVRVNGNDVKDSDGDARITFDAVNNNVLITIG